MSMVMVPQFDGNHYENWSLQMKTILKSLGLWDVVENGIQKTLLQEATTWTSQELEGEISSTAENYLLWCKQWMEWKDVTALSLIQSGLSHEIFPWVAYAASSKEAWDLLLVRSLGGPIFQERKLVDLKKEFNNMTMSDAETIHEFVGRFMELVFRMKSCGWKVEDKKLVKKILSSLPPRFDKVLVDVAERLSLSVVIDCLLVHEYNMKPVGESSVIDHSVDVEENFQEEGEILYTLNEITQYQVSLMKRQGEVLSLVQQNQKMLTQMQKQMMQQQDHILLLSEAYEKHED